MDLLITFRFLFLHQPLRFFFIPHEVVVSKLEKKKEKKMKYKLHTTFLYFFFFFFFFSSLSFFLSFFFFFFFFDAIGLRYQRRGADHEGHVANFVETEQRMDVDTPTQTHTTSYLQLRGSVPLRWSQSGVSFHPEIQMDPRSSFLSQRRVFSRHVHHLQSMYGGGSPLITFLNLLNHQGRENPLRLMFKDIVQPLCSISTLSSISSSSSDEKGQLEKPMDQIEEPLSHPKWKEEGVQ
ncbi:hypothetical protein HMI56_005272 [Coelomomyces lativittatus]|nr:hypothetical protein HMI56_005272 [Coelomomyces lativittatus]